MPEGRWKLVILFHLFGGKTLRFSDLERGIPGISQKMLTRQLLQLEQNRNPRQFPPCTLRAILVRCRHTSQSPSDGAAALTDVVARGPKDTLYSACKFGTVS